MYIIVVRLVPDAYLASIIAIDRSIRFRFRVNNHCAIPMGGLINFHFYFLYFYKFNHVCPSFIFFSINIYSNTIQYIVI